MANMSIVLMIEKILPVITGVSRSGNEWKKKEVIGKTIEEHPKTVCFTLFGDKVDSINVAEGRQYEIFVDVESRSYTDKNGVERWSTSVNCYKAEMKEPQQQSVPQSQSAPTQFTAPTPEPQPTAMDRQADAFFNAQPEPTRNEPAPSPSEELPF